MDEYFRRGYEGYEFVDGEAVEVVNSARSSWLGGNLFCFLAARADVRAGGYAFAQGTELIAGPNVWKPDAMYFSRSRLPGGLTNDWLRVAPDIAVEVLTPGESLAHVARKVEDYLRRGSDLVWVVDPATGSATVYRRGSTASHIDLSGTLDGEQVLPGFSLPLRDLFDEGESAS